MNSAAAGLIHARRWMREVHTDLGGEVNMLALTVIVGVIQILIMAAQLFVTVSK